MEYIAKVTGTVVHGSSRGKQFGFPTINISLSQHVPEGIYISHTIINGKVYHSLSFVGAAITFNEKEIKLETYLFGFDQVTYGEIVEVGLIKKIRDNQKFDSIDELIAQMEKDKKEAEAYFQNLQ